VFADAALALLMVGYILSPRLQARGIVGSISASTFQVRR
jgi:hypothetical protein